MFDYHIHTHFSACTHASMTAQAIIHRAREEGLAEIGLVEHLHPHTDTSLFAEVRKEIDAVRGHFEGRLLQGVEAELLNAQGATTIRGAEAALEVADYTMLAMGHTQLAWVEPPQTTNPDAFLASEARALLIALSTCDVQMVAHPFIYACLRQKNPELAYALRPHRLDPTMKRDLAQCLIDKGVALEYHCRDLVVRSQNLGGEDFVNSWTELMTSLCEEGVLFIPGSDAHYLDQIGRSRAAPPWARNPLPQTHRAT